MNTIILVGNLFPKKITRINLKQNKQQQNPTTTTSKKITTKNSSNNLTIFNNTSSTTIINNNKYNNHNNISKRYISTTTRKLNAKKSSSEDIFTQVFEEEETGPTTTITTDKRGGGGGGSSTLSAIKLKQENIQKEIEALKEKEFPYGPDGRRRIGGDFKGKRKRNAQLLEKGILPSSLPKNSSNGGAVPGTIEAVGHRRKIKTSMKRLQPVLRMAQKVRIVDNAIQQLKMSDKKVAYFVMNCLKNARSNAIVNHGMDPNKLVISRMIMGRATPLERITYASKMRYGIVHIHHTHLSIYVKEDPKLVKKVSSQQRKTLEILKAEDDRQILENKDLDEEQKKRAIRNADRKRIVIDNSKDLAYKHKPYSYTLAKELKSKIKQINNKLKNSNNTQKKPNYINYNNNQTANHTNNNNNNNNNNKKQQQQQQ